SLSERFYRALYQSLLDPRLGRSSKHAMYLNLLFKALKNDPQIVRVEAFIKRLIQICGHHLPPFICGAFYMISELIKKHTTINSFINQPEDHDDDEHFIDVPDDDLDILDRDDDDESKKIQSSSQTINLRKYDGRKRDPQYIALYARQLLENIPIDPPPELHHHTLSHFLDRFVYRNPKKTDRIKGGNPLLQPIVASEPGMVVMKKSTGISKDEINVNSEEFWKKKLDDVPEDQNSDDDKDLEESYFSSEGDDQEEESYFSSEGDNQEDESEDEIWANMKST
ncbi:521_t:CDS:2, partial [Cetraspora pellucida]